MLAGRNDPSCPLPPLSKLCIITRAPVQHTAGRLRRLEHNQTVSGPGYRFKTLFSAVVRSGGGSMQDFSKYDFHVKETVVHVLSILA